MKITLFTLALKNVNINKTVESPLHQLCINSWSKIVTYLESKGYDVEIKIYDEDSPEFKTVYEDCIKRKSCSLRSHWADAFRMYILSEKPRHMWIDWDVYVRDCFEFDFEKEYFMRSFFLIYNKDNTDLFKAVYDKYKNGGLITLNDYKVSAYLEKEKIIDYNFDSVFDKCVIHAPFIDDQPVENLYFVNEEDEKDEFVQQNKNNHKLYRFINPKTRKHHGIFGLYGEQVLIDFIKDNYELTEEQLAKLEE